MEDHLQFLQQLIQSNNKTSLRHFLKYCTECKILTKSGQKCSQLLSLVNEMVKSREKKDFGLVLIEEFLYEFPKPVLNANLISWMDQCVKGIFQGEEAVVAHSYSVICKLLSLNDIQQFKKDINASIVPKLLEYFFKNGNKAKNETNRLEKLKCLAIILRHYGKCCSKYKDQIKILIFDSLEGSRIEVHFAGLCYLYLSLIGPASVENVKYTENWISQTEFVIKALDFRLNSLFENISEISNMTNYMMESINDLPEIDDNLLLDKMSRMALQFESLAEFLYILCRGKIDCRTPIKVEKILNVACRVLFINTKSLYENKSADSLNLLPQMPTLQKASIRIIEAVILSLDFDVFRYVVIPKALLQILSATLTPVWVNDYEKPFSSVRLKAYECLNLWMTTTRTTTIRAEIQKFTNELLNNIISDISKKEETISLNIDVGKSKKQRKKNKSLNVITELPSSSRERTGSNFKTCLAALKIIHPLMEATKFDSKECDFKKLVDIIIVLLSTNSPEEKRSMLYLMDECRLELYRTLLILTLYNKPQNPSPVCYTNKIFQDGTYDKSPEIKNLCTLGLLCTGNILHPSAPLERFVKNSDSLRSFMQKYKMDDKSRPFFTILETEPEVTDNLEVNSEPDVEENIEDSQQEESLDSIPNKKRRLNNIEEKMPEILEEELSEEETNLPKNEEKVQILVEDSEEESEVLEQKIDEPTSQPINEENDELESEMLKSFVDSV